MGKQHVATFTFRRELTAEEQEQFIAALSKAICPTLTIGRKCYLREKEGILWAGSKVQLRRGLEFVQPHDLVKEVKTGQRRQIWHGSPFSNKEGDKILIKEGDKQWNATFLAYADDLETPGVMYQEESGNISYIEINKVFPPPPPESQKKNLTVFFHQSMGKKKIKQVAGIAPTELPSPRIACWKVLPYQIMILIRRLFGYKAVESFVIQEDAITPLPPKEKTHAFQVGDCVALKDDFFISIPGFKHFKSGTKATVIAQVEGFLESPCYKVQFHGLTSFVEVREDQLSKSDPTPYEVGMTVHLTKTFPLPPITLCPGTKVTVTEVIASGHDGQHNHYKVRCYLNKTVFLDFGVFENYLSVTLPEEGKP